MNAGQKRIVWTDRVLGRKGVAFVMEVEKEILSDESIAFNINVTVQKYGFPVATWALYPATKGECDVLFYQLHKKLDCGLGGLSEELVKEFGMQILVKRNPDVSDLHDCTERAHSEGFKAGMAVGYAEGVKAKAEEIRLALRKIV